MKSYKITSRQNETFKIFTELLTSAGIIKHHQALLFGEKMILETVKNHGPQCLGVVSDGRALPTSLTSLTHYDLAPELFEKIDVFGSRFPILLVKPPALEPWAPHKFSGCGLFVPFQEPSNVGAVLRSAAGFGAGPIILGQGSPHPFHPKSSRAASGTLFHHRYFKAPNLGQTDFGDIPVVALDKGGTNIVDFSFPKAMILAPGAEGPGFPSDFKPSKRVSIPISDQVESLNASVAVAVALFYWRVKTPI